MTTAKPVVKIVEVQAHLPQAYFRKAHGSRSMARVVICLPKQKGWLSEKDVRMVYESDHYDSIGNLTGKSHRAAAHAVALAEAKKTAAELQLRVVDTIARAAKGLRS